MRKFVMLFNRELLLAMGETALFLGEKYDSADLCLTGQVMLHPRVLAAADVMSLHGRFFPMSLTPSGYKLNKVLVENLFDACNQTLDKLLAD